MLALEVAIINGGLEKAKRLVAKGADVAEANVFSGYTALLWAAYYGRIPIMHWLLNEAGSGISEKDIHGASALSLAALNGSFPAMQDLLEEQGASMSEGTDDGGTVWDNLSSGTWWAPNSSAELLSLLKVIALLEDAPAKLSFIKKL
jgi:ankyrin repeat protein